MLKIKQQHLLFTLFSISFLLCVYFSFFADYFYYNYIFAFAVNDTVVLKEEELLRQIKIFENLNCGIDSTAKDTHFVKEIAIPNRCSIPVAIIYDDNYRNVWFISTKDGILNNFDPLTKKFESYHIPKWFSRNNILGNSWSWDIKMDKSKNNLWFTDEKQDLIWRFNKPTKTFYQYVIPDNPKYFSSSYPVSLDFDKDGNLYFVGIRTMSLWYGDINKMENGTSKGITEIPIPFKDTFKGIPDYEIGLGSLIVDKERNIVWITALAFDKKGVVIQYKISDKNFNIYNLPKKFTSPVGITIDEDGNLWITDHGTSSFYKILTKNITNTLDKLSIEHFVTSQLSPRIFGIDFHDTNNLTHYQYGNTFPYWIKTGSNNTIWFNEHVGNRLANYNQKDNTLIEYWIPTQNKFYSSCNIDQNASCGYSNALQFDIESKNIFNNSNSNNNKDSKIWFSEQSENKIGYVDLDKNLPISLSVVPKEINFSHINSMNQTIELELIIIKNNENENENITNNNNNNNKNKSFILKPTVSGTFSPNGELINFKRVFNPNLIIINGNSEPTNNIIITKAMVTIKPLSTIEPWNYSIMVGVESKDFSISKKINFNVY